MSEYGAGASRQTDAMRIYLQLIVFLLSAGLALAGIEEIRLVNGKTVKGELEEEKAGVFHTHANGGKLYRWHEIDPASLPAAVRERQRRRVIGWLKQAHALYSRDEFKAALPYFRPAYAQRRYLTRDDRARPEYRNIKLKLQGLVEYKGKFIPFEQRQKALGLVFHQGKWRRKADLEAAQAYKEAMWQARVSRDPVQAVKDLQAVIARYPEADRRQDAEQMIEKLRTAAVKGPEPDVDPDPDPVDAPAPPKFDDYYPPLKAKVEDLAEVKKPELPTPIYPDANESAYPYFKDDDPRPYYIPQYIRDKQGFYHYKINGVQYKSRRPPPKVYLRK